MVVAAAIPPVFDFPIMLSSIEVERRLDMTKWQPDDTAGRALFVCFENLEDLEA